MKKGLSQNEKFYGSPDSKLVYVIYKPFIRTRKSTKTEGVEKRSLFAFYVENFLVLCRLLIE